MLEMWQKEVCTFWVLSLMRHPFYRNGIAKNRIWELFHEGADTQYGLKVPACAPLISWHEMSGEDRLILMQYMNVWVFTKAPLKTFRRGYSQTRYVKLDAQSEMYDQCYRRSIHSGYYLLWPSVTSREMWLSTGHAVVEEEMTYISPEMLQPGAFTA